MENYIEYLYQNANEKRENFIDRIYEFIRYKDIVAIQYLDDNDSYYISCIITWKKEIS